MTKNISVKELSEKLNIPERTIRNYCSSGLLKGAKQKHGVWLIPEDAKNPSTKRLARHSLLEILRRENNYHIHGGIYHKVQIELTYNSNHIEGSRLTHDQTRYIFETHSIAPDFTKKFANVDVNDIVETANHFRCIDYIIDNANRKPSENMLKSLHFILKNGTSDSLNNWFAVGDYKKYPNEVGGSPTVAPEKVKEKMEALFSWYNNKENVKFTDVLEFHYRLEKIHPFQDGNGRVGRLILFKECLRLGFVPFIITNDIKSYYYRGLSEWRRQKGFLTETCLHSQDEFKKWLDYFEIDY